MLRAIITLDPAEPRLAALHPPARQYLNPTQASVVRARPLRNADSVRYFPAETCWDSGQPRIPGTAPR